MQRRLLPSVDLPSSLLSLSLGTQWLYDSCMSCPEKFDIVKMEVLVKMRERNSKEQTGVTTRSFTYSIHLIGITWLQSKLHELVLVLVNAIFFTFPTREFVKYLDNHLVDLFKAICLVFIAFNKARVIIHSKLISPFVVSVEILARHKGFLFRPLFFVEENGKNTFQS